MAEIALRMGRTSAALEDASRGLQLIKRHQLRHEYVRGAASTMAEAYLAMHKSDETSKASPAIPPLREIRKLARRGVQEASKYRNWLPYACRIAARCEGLAGSQHAAGRFLNRSIEAARSLGAEYELAMTLLDHAQFSPDDPQSAKRSLLEARRLLEKCGATFDLAQADRLLESLSTARLRSGSSGLRRRPWGTRRQTTAN
jgi:hypothetical protein